MDDPVGRHATDPRTSDAPRAASTFSSSSSSFATPALAAPSPADATVPVGVTVGYVALTAFFFGTLYFLFWFCVKTSYGRPRRRADPKPNSAALSEDILYSLPLYRYDPSHPSFSKHFRVSVHPEPSSHAHAEGLNVPSSRPSSRSSHTTIPDPDAHHGSLDHSDSESTVLSVHEDVHERAESVVASPAVLEARVDAEPTPVPRWTLALASFRTHLHLLPHNTTTTTIPRVTVAVAPEDVPECAVCLDAFVKRDYVRELPCRHRFHAKCVDRWLLDVSALCPLCKADVAVLCAPAKGETEGESAPVGGGAARAEESAVAVGDVVVVVDEEE
ncbi:hypothetical protein M427DRAFT_58831 [Gonapodya prolifera JEL478]|uniref:RING-type domain-containing protein n=1 Tax=Gonapodya prolifera (strain JEL478) TaxID=1344416 RepID=A0A139A9Y7_GONPJ|nr:hypothetical protein M427DRAFT_58831 [Gonapodya prolifera JEL478]|eukprot:KXS13305.1 hypothetical protein M427DRAFT_58831 [Gonapodya prolifera JEL478]